MNKQELIKEFKEIGVYNLNIFGSEIEGIPTKSAIALIEQLDEPETGHADEAPRYVKNILARLRELPLHDREVWLKAIMGEFEQDFSRAKWREGYEQGKFEGSWVGNQLKDADKIRKELNKVKVPQFVDDYIKDTKYYEWDLDDVFDHIAEESEESEIYKWFYMPGNVDVFARAWLDGCEVEKEKRYLVKMKDLETGFNLLNRHKTENYWVLSSKDESVTYQVCHTHKELEDAGFEWVFDCEGIEIEEVE